MIYRALIAALVVGILIGQAAAVIVMLIYQHFQDKRENK